MPRPFRRLTIAEFEELLARFPFQRRINAVHMHHTWRPDHSDWRGEETIVGMWRFHTEKNGWSDIAQHVTIDPHGGIWTGRSWNQAPASASGNNGNRQAGPFMFEMVGNFDRGRDSFGGAQKEAALRVVAAVQKRFKLPPESLRFHNQMSGKTCPGSAIDYAATLKEVRALLKEPQEAAGGRGAAARSAPFGPEALRRSPEVEAAFQTLLGIGEARAAAVADPADAEPAHEEMSADDVLRATGADDVAGGTGRGIFRTMLTAQELEDLKHHVINLNQGEFSTRGVFTSSRGEVEAVFDEGLRNWIESRKPGEPVHVVFWAHGGLVSEPCALGLAHQQVRWWKENGVYPVYFVWETGALETLGAMIRGILPGGAGRGLGDVLGKIGEGISGVTDPAIEKALRAVKAHAIWTNMKESARRAHQQGGDGAFVAERLRAFLAGLPDADRGRVRLHAVGHSAGSIYHAFFIPSVLGAGQDGARPRFTSAHFLAPAIRVDEFNRRLAPLVGKDAGGAPKGIDRLSIFTMAKSHEKEDSVAVYRKSLLYLIRAALEPEPDRPVPILGLEESLREDAATRALFFPLNPKARDADVVFSVTGDGAVKTKRSASRKHGGFDNDALTLESVLRRILEASDAQKVTDPPSGSSCGLLQVGGSFFARGVDGGFGGDGFGVEDDFGYGGGDFFGGETDFGGGGGGDRVGAGRGPFFGGGAGAPGGGFGAGAFGGGSGTFGAAGGGRRLAVCIGIDQYRSAPLSGCVADAQMWAATLGRLGFGVRMLRNQEATRAGILRALTELVRGSRPGDVLVFQYAGHGTTVPDVTGDEADGDSPAQDEALCPIDMDSGALLIDDDVAVAVRALPPGVNLTFFIDCCHSGTISRFAVGDPAGKNLDRRARFIAPTPQLVEAHVRFRRETGAPTASRARGPEGMREVVFSACRSTEVAFENNGHGDFTVRATPLLLSGARFTHEQFQARVIQAFGPTPAQHPVLDCAPGSRRRVLLAPLVAREGDDGGPVDASASFGGDADLGGGIDGGGSDVGSGAFPGAGGTGDAGEAARLLRAVADLLDRRE